MPKREACKHLQIPEPTLTRRLRELGIFPWPYKPFYCNNKRREVSLDDLEKVFHLPKKEASAHLKISVTTLKRRMRELGIKVWPFLRWRRKRKEVSPDDVEKFGS